MNVIGMYVGVPTEKLENTIKELQFEIIDYDECITECQEYKEDCSSLIQDRFMVCLQLKEAEKQLEYNESDY